MLKRGDRFLILRYSNGPYNCIQNHREVIDKLGYCWFGKIGVAPTEKTLSEKLSENNPLVVLYCHGDAFICQLLEVSTKRPPDGYPLYYQRFLFDRKLYPKMYFKLGSIEEFPKDIFSKCVSLSSKRPLIDSLTRSMASCFYGEYPLDDIVRPLPENTPKKKKEEKKAEAKPKKNLPVDKNSCVYQENGRCTCKRCISYGYECERPNSCAKQKPRVIEQ